MVDALLTATVRVVGQDGYDRASTNRIADVAGVSIGSLYQYFPNKEALVGLALEERIGHMGAVVADGIRALADRPMTSGTRELVGIILLDHARDLPFQAQFHELVAKVGVMRPYLAYRRDLVTVSRCHLERHGEELGRRDIETAAVVVIDLFDALMHSSIHHFPERLTDPAFADEVTAVLLDYLKVPGRETDAPSAP